VLIIELSSEKHALQNIQNDCYEGLSDSCRVHQIRFRPGSRRSPRPPSRLGRGTPHPHSPPPRRLRRLGLVACGDSSSAPLAPRSQNPLRNFFLDTALVSHATSKGGVNPIVSKNFGTPYPRHTVLPKVTKFGMVLRVGEGFHSHPKGRGPSVTNFWDSLPTRIRSDIKRGRHGIVVI